MPRVFRFDLRPTQLLTLFASVTEEIDDVYLGDIRCDVEVRPTGDNIILFAPDSITASDSEAQGDDRKQACMAILQHASRLFSVTPQALMEIPSGATSLSTGLVSALLLSGGTETSTDPLGDEYLVIAQGMDEDGAAELCSDLQFHATHGYLASTIVPSPSDADDDTHQRCFLFHVKADGPKRSSFRALVASGYYEDLPTLRAFSTANGKVFLPDRVTPDAHALHTFSQIADRGAHLFGGLRENASHGLLIAAGGHVPDGAADRSGSIWYLRHLSFQDFVVLQPPRPDEATHFENVSLKSSKDVLDWLKNRIIDAAQNKHELIGYTMELRTTRYINPDDRKLERLRQKEADIREEINWVSSIAQPRPHLLRFTQNQLTAMVDVLRSYPMSALSNGQLLYGYTSDQITPEGHHYLYIRPQLIRIHGDPMARWENLNDSPMRFWIDPFWGDHYFGVSRSQVFVPQNSSLFPAIHTEKAEEMDKYLEMIMKRWYHGKGPVLSVPETPIYVFAPLPGDENKVRVSLLNFKGLKPLKAQLGWLNKTLEIMDDQGTKDFIEKVSVIHKRESILSNLTKEAAEADRCFKATAESVRVQIARHTEDLTELVTEELNQVIIETQDTTTGLKDLDKRLRDLRDLCVDLENLADASKREVSSTEAKIREVETYTSNLAKHAAEEIRQAEAVREGTTKRLEGQIQQMKASRDHLRKMLKS